MSVFKFKQFEVQQDQCAQKIGTDAVLLGAWTAPATPPQNILDIGAGTGVISLMLAQRYGLAQIDAVEIDDLAFEQAASNFENSPYGDRLFCYHASFQEYYEEVDERYELIVSNPPFFNGSLQRDDQQISAQRQQARFDDALPFEELVYGVYQLLDRQGTFACIIPVDRESHLLKITDHFQLVVVRKTYVRGTSATAVKRVLLEFRFRGSEPHNSLTTTQRQIPTVNHLTIERSRHHYTEAYIELTKDFYLKM